MTLNEAIKHASEKAQELYADITYKMCEQGLKSTDKAYEACMKCADEHAQLADWLRELRRLQSLEAHVDTYEAGDYSFSYHEMAGLYTINVMIIKGGQYTHLHEYSLEVPHSHEGFKCWCDNWLSTQEGQE